MAYQGLSVVICCYNSAARLPKTLKYLSNQVAHDLRWEIIVVDNASTDNTKETAHSLLQGFNHSCFSFKIIAEARPGLSFARHAGVVNAQYEIIVFCDDDNWLEKNYLRKAYQYMNTDSKIGALGGNSIAVSDVTLPNWFDDYKDFYAVGQQGSATGDITSRGFVWGAGLVTRRSLFLHAISDDLPSILSDRKGNELSSGGDNEYCQRLVLLGYQIHYHKELVLWHYMTSGRLTVEYRDRLMKALEISSGIVYHYTEAIRFKQSNKLAKTKLVADALADIALKKMTSRKVNYRSFKILYLILGIPYKTDQPLKVIKRFYDV